MRRRGNWIQGFSQRFGKYDSGIKQAITNRRKIWFHAVSVGEVNLCTQLIHAIEPRLPNFKIIVSTTTTTGMGELRAKLPGHVTKIYYPIDRRRYVARALGMFRPEALILVEAEIWPNFIHRARAQGIPLFLVNARLSNRSYRRYKRFGFLFRPLFAAFDGVGAQSESDATRFHELGCRPEAIRVVGSLKFDAAQLSESRPLNVREILRQLGVPQDARLIVGGSTHAGEEGILAQVYLRLKKQFPDLFLVLVPRHFERGREVGRELKNIGLNYLLRTELSVTTRHSDGELDCLVVNSTGELRYFYEPATVIFVGKSLTAEGGQNPIEPGAIGRAMVFGPNMQNFADISQSFLQRKGAVQVRDAKELESVLANLLADRPAREELGRRAREVVSENMGAIEKTVEMILSCFDEKDDYVLPKKQRI